MSKKPPETPSAKPPALSATNFDWSAYMVNDPEAFTRNMVRLVEEGGKAWSALIERSEKMNGSYGPSSEMTEASQVVGEVMRNWLADPTRVAEQQSELFRGYLDVWNATLRRMMGEDVEDIAKPEPGEVIDRAQVRAVAEHFAKLDEAGKLGAVFGPPKGAQDLELVEQEEGWILGA